MKNETTIIYYTSNRESTEFEKKITDNLLKNCGGLPVISVSQKPIDLGINICVGDIGQSYLNEWKQVLIGLKEAKTRFCVSAESDCLYPPEYFNFIPPREDLVYRYGNVWVYWKRRNKFWKKPRCEGAQMCSREYWIERLEKALSISDKPNEIVTKIFPSDDNKSWTGNPVVTFITGDGIGTKTSLLKVEPVKELPYWGTADLISNQIFYE